MHVTFGLRNVVLATLSFVAAVVSGWRNKISVSVSVSGHCDSQSCQSWQLCLFKCRKHGLPYGLPLDLRM